MASQLCCTSHRHMASSESLNIRNPRPPSHTAGHLLHSPDDSEDLTTAAATSTDAGATQDNESTPLRQRLGKVRKSLSRESFQLHRHTPARRKSSPRLSILGSGIKMPSPKKGDVVDLELASVGGASYDNDAQIISDSQLGSVTAPRLPSVDETRSNPSLHWHTLDGGENRLHNVSSEDRGSAKPDHHTAKASKALTSDKKLEKPAVLGNESLKSLSNQYQNLVADTLTAFLGSSSSTVTEMDSGQTKQPKGSAKGPATQGAGGNTASLSTHDGPSSDSSIHLYDMRISQHLRSPSSLSSGSSSIPTVSFSHARNASRSSLKSANPRRYDRLSSFKSNRVPSSWGNVLERNRKSSSYSTLGSSLSNSQGVVSQNKLTDTKEDAEGNNAQESATGSMSNATKDVGSDNVILNEKIASPQSENPAASSTVEISQKDHNNVASQNPSRPVDEKNMKHARKKANHRFRGKTLRALAHQNHRQTIIAFDGPTEEPIDTQDQRRPSRDSIGGNYDETAIVWQKALNAHEEQRMRRKSSVSPSFKSAATQILRGKSISKSEEQPEQSSALKGRRDSLKLKPVETDLTFDRLTVPRNASANHTPPLVFPADDTTKEGENTLYGRRKSASHQHLRESVGSPRKSSSVGHLDASAVVPTLLPKIRVTDAQTSANAKQTPVKRPAAPKRSDSNLAAWGRYPSHTRIERTSSAGTSDAVEPRDFAPQSPPVKDNDSPGEPKKAGHKAKHSVSKARAKAMRQIMFQDWSGRVKPYLVGFRKGETGHRSSIAVGGELEYPELELGALQSAVEPSKTSTPSPNPGTESVNGGSTRHRRNLSLQVNRYSDFEEYPKLDSSVRSAKSERELVEKPNSPSSSLKKIQEKPSRQQLGVPEWTMDKRGGSPNPRRTRTEEVSPLDGRFI